MPPKKKSTPKITSPVDPDYPYATYRIMCPVCGTNLWADMDPPPVQGEEILAGHTCPGRNPELDKTPETPMVAESTPQAEPRASLDQTEAVKPAGSGVARPVPPPPPKPKE